MSTNPEASEIEPIASNLADALNTSLSITYARRLKRHLYRLAKHSNRRGQPQSAICINYITDLVNS